MAKYAAEGVHVTLVTCTLGELGEVIPAELAYLAGTGDRLGEYRRGELAAACAALGVSDHRFLGGAGRWRDSGMAGLESNNSPDSFWQADVAEAAADLAAVIRGVRPRVLVTYDANGFYGHPDHIQAHRVSRRAVTVAADPSAAVAGDPWRVAKFYATAMPRSVAVAAGGPYWVPDEQVTTEIDGRGYVAEKVAAMRSHATQIAIDGEFFALADGHPQRIGAREFYTLLAGPAPRAPSAGQEHDLFAGL